MFSFFRRASKKDAVPNGSVAMSAHKKEPYHDAPRLTLPLNKNSDSKNNQTNVISTEHATGPSLVTENEFSESTVNENREEGDMAPMAAVRGKGKQKRRGGGGGQNNQQQNHSKNNNEQINNKTKASFTSKDKKQVNKPCPQLATVAPPPKNEITTCGSDHSSPAESKVSSTTLGKTANDIVHGAIKLQIDLPSVLTAKNTPKIADQGSAKCTLNQHVNENTNKENDTKNKTANKNKAVDSGLLASSNSLSSHSDTTKRNQNKNNIKQSDGAINKMGNSLNKEEPDNKQEVNALVNDTVTTESRQQPSINIITNKVKEDDLRKTEEKNDEIKVNQNIDCLNISPINLNEVLNNLEDSAKSKSITSDIAVNKKVQCASVENCKNDADIRGNKYENHQKVSAEKISNHILEKVSEVKMVENVEQKENQLIKAEELNKAKEMRNLVNQEARFQAQINELSQQLTAREEETNKLNFQMEELQRDLYVKSSGMDRLQAELLAAHKDSEGVRLKVKRLQDDISNFRQKNLELGDELTKKSEEFQTLETSSKEKVLELESTISDLKEKMKELQTQLDNIKQERDRIEQQKTSLETEREEEKKIVQEALEAAIVEKDNIQKRWEKDFEKLRNVNTDREQQMLDDFEWKLREVEQSCKKRLEEKEKKTEEKIKEAQKDLESKLKLAEQQMNEVIHLKSVEAEVQQLRGLTNDQQRSLKIMTRHSEELQVAEQALKDEIGRLQTVIESEKTNAIMMQRKHEKDIADKERQLQIKLEQQRGEVAVQWEQKLRQECARLKGELDQMHLEEKQLAVELVKVQKEQEYLGAKKQWDTQLQVCQKEIEQLKHTISKKDEKYQFEMERLQTNADRDIMELRRELDKADMAYHEKIEKLTENHEKEIERLNEEAEKRLKDMEANCQMQVSSMRTTLELVKEQMERESLNKIQSLTQEHRAELDKQWEKLMEDKDNSVNVLEQEYRAKFEKLKEQFTAVQKNHICKEKELAKAVDKLKIDVNKKDRTITDLQNNVDTLEGGVQVLNQEINNHSQKVTEVVKEAEQKINELQHALKTERDHIQMEREEHIEEITHMQKQSQNVIEQLQRKCQCLTKLFEEMRSRYEKRESRQEDLNVIADLRNVIAEQERDLAILNEEKRYFQMELMRRQAADGDIGNSNDDFLSVDGSNQSLHEDDECSGQSRNLLNKKESKNLRSRSAGYNCGSRRNDVSLPSSLPG